MKTVTYDEETHVLVTREPTDEMINAGLHGREFGTVGDIWCDMIEAYTPPEPKTLKEWCAERGRTYIKSQGEFYFYDLGPCTDLIDYIPEQFRQPTGEIK